MIQLRIPNPSKVFNDQILAILESYTDPVEVFYGGASSGKSHGVYQKVVLKACQNWPVPRRILVLRKVDRSIKDSSWEHIKAVLSQFKLLPFCKINKSDFTITLPNGAIFMFKGLDDPEKIKSIKGVSDIVMEEATEFNLDDFTQLRLRLRDPEHEDRQMFLMFNPISKKNWVYDYFFMNDSGAKLYWSTYKDNKFLDQATRDALEDLKHRNPAYYRIYALGEFATLDKLIFPVTTVRVISDDEVKGFREYNGLDFGYVNDPSALVSVRYDPEMKRIYITKEFVKKGMLNDEIATTIAFLGLAKEEIYADSQEQKSIEEIRRMGVSRIKPVRKGKDSVIQGIQWLAQHEIIIDSRCFKVREEAENYTWQKDKKTGEYTNEPVDGFNHTWDAIRYALSDLIRGVGKVKLLNRSIGF